jgi:hypothetical protein
MKRAVRSAMKCCVRKGGKPLMKLSARSETIMAIVTWVLLPLAAFSQNRELAIKRLIRSSACAVQGCAKRLNHQWDGVGFFGPHSSKCKSTVTLNHGNQYEIRTSCSALGDGSANPSGTPFVESFTLTLSSNSEFTITKGDKRQRNYQWCDSQ